MAYAVIGYPDLNKYDQDIIHNYRKNYDEWLYNVVKPHFSFVFPTNILTEKEFKSEIKELSAGFRKINFVIRCAVVNKDSFSDWFHVFLVPDEGYSNIVKLHDELYSSRLKDELRLDIDFIPHMGVGTSRDQYKCKKMADEWNRRDFQIAGTISRLVIVEFNGKEVLDLEYLPLE